VGIGFILVSSLVYSAPSPCERTWTGVEKKPRGSSKTFLVEQESDSDDATLFRPAWVARQLLFYFSILCSQLLRTSDRPSVLQHMANNVGHLGNTGAGRELEAWCSWGNSLIATKAPVGGGDLYNSRGPPGLGSHADSWSPYPKQTSALLLRQCEGAEQYIKLFVNVMVYFLAELFVDM
jgi:hypothetical protein